VFRPGCKYAVALARRYAAGENGDAGDDDDHATHDAI
jgi:hypothetical protein